MIQRDITAQVNPTPKELAEELATTSNEEQAVFVSELAEAVAKWNKPVGFQLQYLVDSPKLSDDGRSLMQLIGQYAEV